MRKIERKCLVCGEKLTIKVEEDGTYQGGHFFGVVKLPVGEGEHREIGRSEFLDASIVEWTGEKEEIEYWECERCFRDGENEHLHKEAAEAIDAARKRIKQGKYLTEEEAKKHLNL